MHPSHERVLHFLTSSIVNMFCPHCQTEYRAGFTRCSDCDVDLVSDLSESDNHAAKSRQETDFEELQRGAERLLPTITNLYSDGRKTVRWWPHYRRQTGSWPWTFIVIHIANWVAVLFGRLFLIWWPTEHDWSPWKFLGVLLLEGLPYTILEHRGQEDCETKLFFAKRAAPGKATESR
jgi:hypothetical protein